tara:strand:- start:58 stop:489 length:432 start_codon:yes stop_codon:yes gene_type:complete
VEDPFTVVNGVATAINPLITQVHEYELEGDGNTLNEVIVSDRNTGSSVNTQTLVTVLKAMDVETTNELNLAAYGFPMCVVRDRNGNFLCVGIDDGIDFTIDKATGGAKTDLNGYTMTGVSTTGALSPHMDDATRDAFLLLVSS